jgi:hypothetical protein
VLNCKKGNLCWFALLENVELTTENYRRKIYKIYLWLCH